MSAFIKSNNLGLWVSIKKLKSSNPRLPTIVLLPMVHIADKPFFEEMYWEKWCADVLLFEGNDTRLGNYASRAMHFASKSRRLNAAFQSHSRPGEQTGNTQTIKETRNAWHQRDDGVLVCDFFQSAPEGAHEEYGRNVRWLRADLDERSSKETFDKMPWWLWPLLPFVALGAAIFMRFAIGRRRVVETLSETRSSKPLEDGSVLSQIESYVLGDRDEHLYQTLRKEILNQDNEDKTIIVQYGAGHMDELYARLAKNHCYSASRGRPVLALAHTPVKKNLASVSCYGQAEKRYWHIMGFQMGYSDLDCYGEPFPQAPPTYNAPEPHYPDISLAESDKIDEALDENGRKFDDAA